ncbi:hypothetical protein F511_19261 [Dorcoceras hygrometricum]|uniref:Uncharacterized protein n=1 Tax=Dorcoceras hygrometricum TaxID=472368 RepID=A0A2Z7B6B1_9LAMI|nr:hypothetical protein F511_19261 [Dorcoceras hygrometricum]
MRENKATTATQGAKESQGTAQSTDTNQLNNNGHGVCEYMGTTHSSQHTAPDAKHSSTRCCPTHEMWELPTPLIVANRSQQGDEVYGSYPLVLNRHPGKMSNIEHIPQYKAYTAASIIIHAQSNAVKQAHIRTSNLLCYNYSNRVPSNTDLTPAKPNTNTSYGTALNNAQGRNTYPTSYLNGRRNPTLMLIDYRREMSSHTSPASRNHPKAASSEASQQEESSATTLTSIGAIYHRQSEKIRFDPITTAELNHSAWPTLASAQFPRKNSNSPDLFQGIKQTRQLNQAYELKAGSSQICSSQIWSMINPIN